MASATDEYLTVAEAAALLKVSHSTIWRAIKRGDLPAHRIGQRGVRLRREDLSVPVQETATPMRVLTSLEEIRALEPTSDETRRQWALAGERAARHAKALSKNQRMEPCPEGWELLNEARDERTRQLEEALGWPIEDGS